jgi:hypothetical protein
VGKIVGETRERFGNFVTLAEEGDLPRKIVEMRERRPRLETRNKVTEYAWSRIASQMEHALQQAMLGGRTCH